jgi:hypothetical protein
MVIVRVQSLVKVGNSLLKGTLVTHPFWVESLNVPLVEPACASSYIALAS